MKTPSMQRGAMLAILVLLTALNMPTIAQDRPSHTTTPRPVRPLTHPPGLLKASMPHVRSFYSSKADWQHIIDSTWGPGLPLASKLTLFDSYANALAAKFDGFLSLGLDWDSLRTTYRSRIDSSTSRGGFAALMARFASSLRDGHTWALDTIVTHAPLAPGVPLLVLEPFASAEHFGAVLTTLPDSTALVLRTVPNHPLGLEPGDIVLGYEGVPWKHLVRELLDANLPMYFSGVGAASAETHALLRNVGNNWHLFETIDILKHATQETVHLSVAPLLWLPSDYYMGNEQLDIPGIPPAEYAHEALQWFGRVLDYGTLPGTSVGYIRLVSEWPTDSADAGFLRAFETFRESDGLIIDLRWNAGGWALFDGAFAQIFSQSLPTIEDAVRAGALNFALVPKGNSSWFQIPGAPGSLYTRPIAVLLGPTCVSMGDITAQRLRYHPMVRFFGKPPIASHGDNEKLTGFRFWSINYSFTDMFHTNQPGVYLNRAEFPVDEPVWFNADDVARGVDPVVERALEWISTVAHMHHVSVTSPYVRPGGDSVTVTAVLSDPLGHAVEAFVRISSPEVKVELGDSFLMMNDGLHGDGLAGDSVWGARCAAPDVEGMFDVGLTTRDLADSTFRHLPSLARFTTAGPIVVAQTVPAQADSFPNWGDHLMFRFIVRNDGWAGAVSAVRGRVRSLDTLAAVLSTLQLTVGDMTPGQSRLSSTVLIGFSQWGSGERDLAFEFTFSSQNIEFWKDTIGMHVSEAVGIAQSEDGLPVAFRLGQNYPNPFNPSTTIRYDLPRRAHVSLSVFNTLGQQVASLVEGEEEAGYHEVQFDASQVSSGVYFYRLCAGKYVETKKMLLMR
jgi:hypothetical protein